ncbi:MAG: nitroreductase family protein [Phycisphaeraceae bacterium]|nr:nitroreductase family protein [Phycisphaeraceae bacterium]
MTDHNSTDHPVLAAIKQRYSAYQFADKPVEAGKLRSLFEAARWAASSFNEQPWRFIVATKENQAEYEKALSCLVEANRGWAQAAPVLVLAAVKQDFTYNASPNRVAQHDLGQAAAHIALQAAELGLVIHQMAGIDQGKAASTYNLPDGFTAETAIAIGYPAEGDLNDAESKARQRKPFDEFVFGDAWGRASGLF